MVAEFRTTDRKGPDDDNRFDGDVSPEDILSKVQLHSPKVDSDSDASESLMCALERPRGALSAAVKVEMPRRLLDIPKIPMLLAQPMVEKSRLAKQAALRPRAEVILGLPAATKGPKYGNEGIMRVALARQEAQRHQPTHRLPPLPTASTPEPRCGSPELRKGFRSPRPAVAKTPLSLSPLSPSPVKMFHRSLGRKM